MEEPVATRDSGKSDSQTTNTPQVPRTFGQYLLALGPGVIVVLTWLGAGDIVSAGVAGGNYGYSLMWVLVLSVLVRFAFVSLIAKFQLCNPRGESVLHGLVRLHPWFAPFLAVSAVIISHIYGAYMLSGCGETWVALTGTGVKWQWAIVWSIAGLLLVFRPVYHRVELVFKIILAALTVSLLGTAIWAGPNPIGMLHGALGFALPEKMGPFGGCACSRQHDWLARRFTHELGLPLHARAKRLAWPPRFAEYRFTICCLASA